MGFFKLIPLRLWLGLGLAVALVGYHYYDRHQAIQEAVQQEAAKWQDSIAKANAQAQADHAQQQARIDELAKQSQPALAAKVAQQQKMVDALVKAAQNPPKVFTKDCTLPPEQVQAYNSIGK